MTPRQTSHSLAGVMQPQSRFQIRLSSHMNIGSPTENTPATCARMWLRSVLPLRHPPAIYRTLTLLFTLQKPPHFAYKQVRQRTSILPLRHPYLAAPTVYILLIDTAPSTKFAVCSVAATVRGHQMSRSSQARRASR